MNNKNNLLLHVYAGNQHETLLLKEILADNRIVALVKNEPESGRLAGFSTSTTLMDLYVNEEDVAKTKELIKEFNQQ